MAETKTHRSETGRENAQSLAHQGRERHGALRRQPSLGSFDSPLDFFDRMSEEMDRTFGRLVRNFGSPRRSLFAGGGEGLWSPRVEAFQKGDSFIVRADLPGLKKEDVQVELTDDAITIRGERREQHEEQREGYFHSEREYGQFYRTIPLPEGVIGESAKASFRDGVLEVTMQAAPAEANRGRRVEIADDSSERKK